MVTNEGADVLKRILRRDEIECLSVLALRDLLNIRLSGNVMRARALAGRGEVRLFYLRIACEDGNVARRLNLWNDESAHLGEIGVAVLLHIFIESLDHRSANIVARDESLGTNAEKSSAAENHLNGIAPVGDTACRHNGSVAAHLADLVGIALCKRLEPLTAMATHGDLLLEMIESTAGLVDIDGGHTETVTRAAYRVSTCLVESLRNLGDLASLGSELDEEGNGDRLLYRSCDLCGNLCLLTHAGTCLLLCRLTAAAGHLEVVAHVGATHIKLDDVGTCLLELLCHINPALNAGVTCVGDVSHEL